MIIIKTSNGTVITPKPGTTAEIERNSPLFSSGNEWAGEASTPINLPYTKEVSTGLGYPFSFYTRRLKKRTDADLWDGTFFRKSGKLITENGSINQNHIEQSELNGYFVFSLSNFYHITKDKSLQELKLDGLRRFNFTTNNPADASNGWWQYIHGTWAGDKDFVCAPIRNELIAGSSDGAYPSWINPVMDDGYLNWQQCLYWNILCPQIKLKYLLTKIFEEHGYSIVFDLGDDQWEKLHLVSLKAFDWTDMHEVSDWPFVEAVPKDVIDVYLNKHLPDKTINDFLIQICNKYGWRPLINDDLKICRLKSFKNIQKGERKDWTKYMSAIADSDHSEDEQIISFKNEIDSGDSAPVQPDFDGKKILGSYYGFVDLPAASGFNEGMLAYTVIENSWWICNSNSTTHTYEWDFYGDNIFNYEPENSNVSIDSTVSTLPVARVLYEQDGFNYGIFPVMKQEGEKEFGYRTLFYYGMVPNQNEDGSYADGFYPHLSSIWRTPSTDIPDGIWSNVYKHDYNDVKRGIIDYWFTEWLDVIKQGETLKLNMNIPRNELLNFEWDDIIILKNIPFLVKSMIEPIPYKNKVEITLRRIG